MNRYEVRIHNYCGKPFVLNIIAEDWEQAYKKACNIYGALNVIYVIFISGL